MLASRVQDWRSRLRLSRSPLSRFINITACLAIAVGSWSAEPAPRPLPKALADHPGNIFVAGEQVAVALPGAGSRWRLVDYDGNALGEFQAGPARVALGKLPVDFYRFESAGGSNWVSFAVLESLRAPTPLTSPIGIDVAMAWFYGRERMDAVANLGALAGVNWVRDRLNWAEMEPERGRFSKPNKYDASAVAQSGAGLRVLQVIHHSPGWANPNGKRFPLDLRDAYRFFEAMAKRWRGQVRAFEPWNEADIPMFGGHTGAEMASLQKAAYLGSKAGDPDLIVCLNVFAAHRTNQLADLQENKAWPYFETYNLHHYERFENYPKLYADHRAISAGRPLWVTECAVPVKWAGDDKLKEPTDADLKVQAERVAKTFAWSLHERSVATFYFLLPHYVEGQTQFGIVRPDLTPRPAYVALAAAGRLLADAKPLGRVPAPDEAVRVFAFRARPDGRERDVLVAWTTNCESAFNLPSAPEELFDHLGRARAVTKDLQLTEAPIFVILPRGGATQLRLTPPPTPPAKLEGSPSPVVLQALWPEEKVDLSRSAYRIGADQPATVQVYVYNFDPQVVRGQLSVETSSGWEATLPAEIELVPLERKELSLVVKRTGSGSESSGRVRVRGDFGNSGKPTLSLRLTMEAAK